MVEKGQDIELLDVLNIGEELQEAITSTIQYASRAADQVGARMSREIEQHD